MFRLKEVGSPPALGLVVVLAVCLGALCCGSAHALGTPAGTVIANTATIHYSLASDPTVRTASVAHSFDVLEIIDLVITWQDAAPVPVNTPHSGSSLTFLLTNTGNGPEAFGLTATHLLAGDDFDPLTQELWLETNATIGLQTTGAAPDTLYQAGLNDPDLPSDGALIVYLLADIPAHLADGAVGLVRLDAAATTAGAAGAAPGSELAGAGANGANAVVGTTRAVGQDTGRYIVSGVGITLTKGIVRITDRFGGDQPYPGAHVTYRITVDVTGSGTAEGLVISDPLPADMTYLPGSLVLDGAGQTDAADAPADRSDFGVTTADTITVDLGDQAPPAAFTIEFTTIIK